MSIALNLRRLQTHSDCRQQHGHNHHPISFCYTQVLFHHHHHHLYKDCCCCCGSCCHDLKQQSASNSRETMTISSSHLNHPGIIPCFLVTRLVRASMGKEAERSFDSMISQAKLVEACNKNTQTQEQL